MPPVAFNPNEPFEEVAEATPQFDPSKPFEESSPAFDPNQPFEEVKGVDALIDDPLFAKRNPTTVREKFNAAMEPLTVAGRTVNAAAQDAAATLTGNPSQGGNLITMATKSTPETSAVLPYQKNLADISKSNPGIATAGKIAGGLVESVPMLAVLPQGVVGNLIGAGFTADMISHIPEAGKILGEEMGKNPEDRDHDKITTALATIASSSVMAGAGVKHIGGDVVKSLASKLKSAPVEAPPAPIAPEPQIGLNGEFAKTHPTAEPLPGVETVALDPQTGQPVPSSAQQTINKLQQREAELQAQNPAKPPAPVVAPEVVSETPAKPVKTELPEVRKGDKRIQIIQPDGTIVEGVTNGKNWDFGKGPIVNVGRAVDGKWSDGPLRPGEKVHTIEGNAAVPQPDWRVSVQPPEGDVPGFVQLVDPRGKETDQSPTVESLRAMGHDIPDFSKLPKGQYTFEEAVAKSKESAPVQPKKETPPVEPPVEVKPETPAADPWNLFGEELRDNLDSFSPARDKGRVDHELNDVAARFVEFARKDTSGKPLSKLVVEFTKQDEGSRSQLNKLKKSVKQLEEGGKSPVKPVEPKPEVKSIKRNHEADVAAKKAFVDLVHEWGERMGFVKDLTRYSQGLGRIKRGNDTASIKGRFENQKEVKAAHEMILRAVGQDPAIKTPAAFADALPKLHRLIEDWQRKQEEDFQSEQGATTAEKAQSALDAWDAEVGAKPETAPKPPPEPPAEPGDVGPGLGGAKLGEVEPAGTGLKNAVGELERASHGLPEAYPGQRQGMAKAWQESADILAKDPQAGKKLADELKHNPERGMTDVDSALLLRHKVELENAKNQAAEDNISAKTPEARAEAQARFDDLSSQLLDLLDAAKFRGSQWGREGRWRQALAFEDYSLETMVHAKQVELGDKLTPSEHAEVKRLQEKIAELEKKLAAKKATDATGKKSVEVDEAVADTVKKTRAQSERDKKAGIERDLAAEEKEALDYLKESFGENGDFRDTQNVIRKLMELLAQAGVRERLPMEDAIHRFLQGIDPNITREQAQDLMSGYGKSRLPSQEPAKKVVRDINAQILSVRKLLDYFKGQRPKLTGQLRDVPSQIQRNLLKMVNEAKKAFKLEGPEDNARAVKSALDAVNTRLKNRLADLKQEVVTRRKIIREKSPSPYNEETLRLKREIEEVKRQHDEIFGTEMSDAQRLALAEKQADRQIAELERQIKTGEIFPKSKEEFHLRSDKLDAAKARLEELKLTRQFAREATQPRPEREARQLEARVKALDKQIENLERQLKNDEVFPKGKTLKEPSTDPRMIARQEKIDALKAEREYARQRLQPGLDVTEAFLLNYQARLRRMASKYQERLARGDFEPKPKKTPPVDPVTNRLSFELNQAKAAWHEAMMKDRLAKRSKFKKALSAGQEVLNTSRAVLTSADLSAVLRQGGFIALAHPIRAAKAFPAMFKALRSKEGQHAVNEEIMARPNYPEYQRAKLYLSNHGGKLSQMEEAYMTRWAEKIPLVAASERAYVTFLNKLRADSYDAMKESLGRKGELTPEESKAVANFINVATGRGSLGAKEQALVGLNTVFFAPRYVASRFQLLAGQPMYRGSMRTRLAVAKEYGRFLAGIGIIYGLAQLDGAELEGDPRSSDFGKLKYGKTRVDPLAGLQQVTVLLSRLASGKTINNQGKLVPIRGNKVPPTGSNAWDVMTRFARTKLAPWAGTGVDIGVGRNLVGDEVTPGSVAQNMLVPLSMQDIYATMIEQGIPRGTALSLLSTFGMGLQTREDKK